MTNGTAPKGKEGGSKGGISRLAQMRKPQCTVVHEDFRIKRNEESTPATSSSAPTLLTSSSKNSLITVQLLIKQRPIDAGNAACVALTMKIFPVFIGLFCQDGKVSDFFSSKAVVANFATTGIPANPSFRALFTCLPPEILLYTFPGKFH